MSHWSAFPTHAEYTRAVAAGWTPPGHAPAAAERAFQAAHDARRDRSGHLDPNSPDATERAEYQRIQKAAAEAFEDAPATLPTTDDAPAAVAATPEPAYLTTARAQLESVLSPPKAKSLLDVFADDLREDRR